MMIAIALLWLLPALIVWAVVIYEAAFTEIYYSKKTFIATCVMGLVPVINLILAVWWINERIWDLLEDLRG